jgi:hypothetical protein
MSAAMVTATSRFEKSALQKVLLSNVLDLRRASEGDRLQGAETSFLALGADGKFAKQAHVGAHVVNAGDLVMLQGRAFLVSGCASAHQTLHLLLKEMQLKGQTASLTKLQPPASDAQAELWIVDDTLRSDLYHVHCWRQEGDFVFAVRAFEKT